MKKDILCKIIIMIYLYYSKMAKEMNVSCDFMGHKLSCVLPDNTMDVLLKVQRTLKYRRWNNEVRPFCSLKRRVANIFRKRNSFSDSSRGTSTQTIVNKVPEQGKTEEKDSETDSERESVHSNWSDFIPVEINKSADATVNNVIPQKIWAVRNIVLVPYKPKPKDWGSWRVKSPYVTSTIASPILDKNNQPQTSEKDNEGKVTYVPHSPYYEPVHSPQFYGDE